MREPFSVFWTGFQWHSFVNTETSYLGGRETLLI